MGRHARRATREAVRDARFLGGLTAVLGTLHFVKPEVFDRLIPEALPGEARAWTLGSGVAELGVAAGLLYPKTRRVAGRAATLLYLAVFPGNLQMAWNWRGKSWHMQVISLGRLPLQAGLIRRAENVHRNG